MDATNFTIGDRVRYAVELDAGDMEQRFDVVEDNGDRVRIRLVCDLPIRPERVALRAELVRAAD